MRCQRSWIWIHHETSRYLLLLLLLLLLLPCLNAYRCDSNANISKNPMEQVEVKIWPQIFSLIELDEKIGSITFIQWITLIWKEECFENAKIDTTTMNIKDIWMPDIVILNAMKSEKITGLGGDFDTVQVYNNGLVEYSYPNLVTQRCHSFDLTRFPFDTQNCSTRFASWTMTSDRLKLTPVQDDLRIHFQQHSEWILDDLRPYRINETGTMASVSHRNALRNVITRDEVRLDLILRRKPEHYIYTVALPCFIIITLSIIGLFSPFSSSGERQEKVTLGLNTLLAVTVLLLMISEEMPRNLDGQSQPLLVKYILAEMFLCIGATTITMLTLTIHRHVLMQQMLPPKLPNFCRENWLTFLLARKQQVLPEDTDILIEKRQHLQDNLDELFFRRKMETKRVIGWYKLFTTVDFAFMLMFQACNLVMTANMFSH